MHGKGWTGLGMSDTSRDSASPENVSDEETL